MNYSNIKFDNNLTKNKTCKLTYSGQLFQNGSEFVNIVYGFGNEWHHTKEQEMERTDEGFVVNVNILDFDTFNFCFRNSNYEWDNNNNQNYTSPIVEEVEGVQEEENFILNDDSVITNILNSLCEIDVSDIETKEIEPVIIEENTPFEIEIETNTPVNIEDSLVNITEAENLEQDIEKLFTDIYQETTVDVKKEPENAFDMNNLIDEILTPIAETNISNVDLTENIVSEDVDSNAFEYSEEDIDADLDNKIDNLITNLFNNTKAFAESKKTEIEQEVGLIEVDTENNFVVSTRALGKFYMLKKKIKLAISKLFVAIPKIILKAFDTEGN